jgi:hypothetical protein
LKIALVLLHRNHSPGASDESVDSLALSNGQSIPGQVRSRCGVRLCGFLGVCVECALFAFLGNYELDVGCACAGV